MQGVLQLVLRFTEYLLVQVVLLQAFPPFRQLHHLLHRVDPPLLHSPVDTGRQHQAPGRRHVYVVGQLLEGRDVGQTGHGLLAAERESPRIAGLSVRDIMGYTTITLFVGGMVMIAALLIVGAG